MIILETQRLILRRLLPTDLNDLFTLYRDPDIRRYYPDGVRTLEETRGELEWFLNGHPDHPELGLWAMVHKETGKFLGRSGLLPWTIDGVPEVEVAYMVDKAYWRQGYGSEAAQAITEYGFEKLKLSRLICLIGKEHAASIAVATKIGMSFEKEIEDEFGSALVYSQSR